VYIVQAAIKESPWIAGLCLAALVFLPSLSKIVVSFFKYIVGLVLGWKAMKAGYDKIRIGDIELSRSEKQQQEKDEDKDKSSCSKVIDFPGGVAKEKDKRQE